MYCDERTNARRWNEIHRRHTNAIWSVVTANSFAFWFFDKCSRHLQPVTSVWRIGRLWSTTILQQSISLTISCSNFNFTSFQKRYLPVYRTIRKLKLNNDTFPSSLFPIISVRHRRASIFIPFSSFCRSVTIFVASRSFFCCAKTRVFVRRFSEREILLALRNPFPCSFVRCTLVRGLLWNFKHNVQVIRSIPPIMNLLGKWKASRFDEESSSVVSYSISFQRSIIK